MAMSVFRGLVAVLSLATLAACGGGGGGAGTMPFGSGSGTGLGTTDTGTGTSTEATPTASQLSLQLDATSIDNSGAKTVNATATAATAGGQTVFGVPVTFTVDNNAIYTPSATTTNASGVVTAAVSIGADRSNRIVTVIAKSGTLTATRSFAVTGSTLTGTRVPAITTPGSTGNRVDFRLVDANNNPMAGQPITVNAGSLASVSGATDQSGSFSFSYTAPAVPGSLNIVGTSGGVSTTQTVIIQSPSSTTVPTVTEAVRSASVAADPSVVAPNDAINPTTNRVEIRALFVGTNNRPIQNMRVRFDLAGDLNNVGGGFSTGDNIVYTDALGVATTAYIPGPRSSPTNGVVVRACYGFSDFTVAANGCQPQNEPVAPINTITVAQPPLAVTIGTDRQVISETLTYKQQFVILVTDAAGVAKGNVTIVPSIDLTFFGKGSYVRGGDRWVHTCVMAGNCAVIQPAPVFCPNEDRNRNGVIENIFVNPPLTSAGLTSAPFTEDRNRTGTLEPRKSDVAISVVGSTQTDATGKAIIQIEYPKNVGSWLNYRVTVSANGVAGTEGRAQWSDLLLVPLADIMADGAPPFIRSPYGVNNKSPLPEVAPPLEVAAEPTVPPACWNPD